MPPTQNTMALAPESATQRVFQTVELLELVLLEVAAEHGPTFSPLDNCITMYNLISARQVSRHWHVVINNSNKLQRILFHEPSSLSGKPHETLYDVLLNGEADLMPLVNPYGTDSELKLSIQINPLLQKGFNAGTVLGLAGPSTLDPRETTYLCIPDWVPTNWFAGLGLPTSAATWSESSFDDAEGTAEHAGPKRCVPRKWPHIWSQHKASARTSLFAEMFAVQPPVKNLLCKSTDLFPGHLVCASGVRMRHLMVWRDAVIELMEHDENAHRACLGKDLKDVYVRVEDDVVVDGRVVKDAVFVDDDFWKSDTSYRAC